MAENKQSLRRSHRILVFDSGVGGLSVLRALRPVCGTAEIIYAADNAAFPYGDWDEADLEARVCDVIGALIGEIAPDLVVIACNTASTLALAPLRARFDIPFVGTVPAIRVAARQTKSGIIGVLATPGTVKRDYTRDLIDAFARDCRVVLCASERLAGIAETKLCGGGVDKALLRGEIEPAFVAEDGRRTDAIVLACTHYPFLADELAAAAPWPVNFIDPAPAIARRAAVVLSGLPARGDQTGEAASGGADFGILTENPPHHDRLTALFREFDLKHIDIQLIGR